MAKLDPRLLTLGAVVVLVFILFILPRLMRGSSSSYDVSGMNLDIYSMRGSQARVNTAESPNMVMSADVPSAQIMPDSFPMPTNAVSTSLLPREIPSSEDFGTFSPDAIMEGQNYLDPRSQIGYPETLGGVLRNANYDIRSEPSNPRVPVSIFNNSTIVPDLMRPQFEIGR